MYFRIKGVSADGAILNLSVDAGDADDAAKQAQAQGVRIVSLRSDRSWGFSLGNLGKADKASANFPLLQFNKELLALLNAGINLIEAIQTLLEKEYRPQTKKVLSNVINRLRDGLPFSAALESMPGAFPALYCATVQASERIGSLPESLSRYIAYQAQIEIVRKKLIAAAIYPVLLIAVGTLVLGFLLVYVVPRFSHIYADMGNDLPWMSRALMAWGQFLEQRAWMALGTVVAALMLVWWLITRPGTQQMLSDMVRRIPAIGMRMHTYQLARFYRTLGMLLRGGMSVVPSLRMVSGLLHSGMRAQLDAATESIRNGLAISPAMEAHALVTPVALRMLRVGERTGRMGEMMEKIAEFHDEEMERWVDWFGRLLEPLLMVVIGVIIGTVVLLMYLPIFDLAGNLK